MKGGSRAVAIWVGVAILVVAAFTWWRDADAAVVDTRITRPAIDEEVRASMARGDERPASAPRTAAAVDPERERAAPPTTGLLHLRVVDDATGEELSEVHVEGYPLISSPPAPAVLVERGRSPLAFEPFRDGRRAYYLVRTPRHAWSGLSVRSDDASINEVRLKAGGDVAISLTGSASPPGSVVRVRSAGNEHVKDIGAIEFEADVPANGALLADGLPAASLVFRVEKGEPGDEPALVGRTEATVVAGALTQVAIHCESVAAPPAARVAGTLTISPAWSVTSMWLEPRGTARPWRPEDIRIGLEDMQRVSDREYRWDAGELLAGWYRVAFAGVDSWSEVHVDRTDRLDHRIIVPDPCDVSVRVVDAATGDAIVVPDRSVAWCIAPPDDVGGTIRAEDAAARDDGAFAFRVPPARVWVRFVADEYRPLDEFLEVRADKTVFTLRARRDFGIDVVVQHEGSVVSWRAPWVVVLHDAAGQPADGATRCGARPDSPGRYWIRIENLGEYEADPVLVEVPEIGFATVVVPVRRR